MKQCNSGVEEATKTSRFVENICLFTPADPIRKLYYGMPPAVASSKLKHLLASRPDTHRFSRLPKIYTPTRKQRSQASVYFRLLQAVAPSKKMSGPRTLHLQASQISRSPNAIVLCLDIKLESCHGTRVKWTPQKTNLPGIGKSI